jgi:hypothetical protein
MAQIGNVKRARVPLDEALIRHMVLNSLRATTVQFKKKYGKVVICCDSGSYWRRAVFPLYKANRKKERDATGLDWNLIFATLQKIREELMQFFPYKVLRVDQAEADDIIAVLTKRYASSEAILIVSSDKDFGQLQYLPNVEQYSPIKKRFVRTDNPQKYLLEHIMTGDRSDGIPNFLSADDCLARGVRQTPLSTKKLEAWLEMPVDKICGTDTLKHGFDRNKQLIDFDAIPEDVSSSIVEAFDAAQPASKQVLMKYLMANRLKELVSVLDEF